jgi:hypothetical protein
VNTRRKLSTTLVERKGKTTLSEGEQRAVHAGGKVVVKIPANIVLFNDIHRCEKPVDNPCGHRRGGIQY